MKPGVNETHERHVLTIAGCEGYSARCPHCNRIFSEWEIKHPRQAGLEGHRYRRNADGSGGLYHVGCSPAINGPCRQCCDHYPHERQVGWEFCSETCRDAWFGLDGSAPSPYAAAVLAEWEAVERPGP